MFINRERIEVASHMGKTERCISPKYSVTSAVGADGLVYTSPGELSFLLFLNQVRSSIDLIGLKCFSNVLGILLCCGYCTKPPCSLSDMMV